MSYTPAGSNLNIILSVRKADLDSLFSSQEILARYKCYSTPLPLVSNVTQRTSALTRVSYNLGCHITTDTKKDRKYSSIKTSKEHDKEGAKMEGN